MSDKFSGPIDAQPAIVRPALLAARDRGGGARTVPIVTRALGAKGEIGVRIPSHERRRSALPVWEDQPEARAG